MLQNGRLIYNGTLENYRELHPPILSLRTSDNDLAAKALNSTEFAIRGERLILNHPDDDEVAEIVRRLSSVVDIYRIEEERESLETLFINDTKKGGTFLRSLESRKYRHLHIYPLLGLLFFVHIFVSSISVFSSSFVNETYPLFRLLDGYFMIQLIFSPVLFSSLVKKS